MELRVMESEYSAYTELDSELELVDSSISVRSILYQSNIRSKAFDPPADMFGVLFTSWFGEGVIFEP
ncbi:19708_t:CDS:2 [Rhizophagus irregularis]|nr:19708_t:CDS:2 [Rhizophagus irregularis]